MITAGDRRAGAGVAATAGRRAFTLVELLAVVVIIGLLISLTLPAVQRFREAARRAGCAANLAAMGTALTNHESARRRFPPGSDTLSERLHAWSSFILPYLEEERIARRIDYRKAWNAPGGNAQIADTIVSTYVCPSGIVCFPGKQDYGGVMGSAVLLGEGGRLPRGWEHGGVLYATSAEQPLPARAAMITDGLSHTLTVSEGVDRGSAEMDGELEIGNARWACGTNCFLLNTRVINVPDVDAFRSNHLGGVHGLFADGHVLFIADDTAPETLAAWCTKAGGEPVATGP